MAFELSWNVMKDYGEAQIYSVRSPRDAIKTAVQMGIIEDGYVWIDGLSNRNLTTYTYDETMAEKVRSLIINKYFPVIKVLQQDLKKEVQVCLVYHFRREDSLLHFVQGAQPKNKGGDESPFCITKHMFVWYNIPVQIAL